MSFKRISSQEFRREVAAVAEVLTSHGFRHAPLLDDETPTNASVVYVGQHVAFKFTLDIRDQAVDLIVMRHRNGSLEESGERGRSPSLFAYLRQQSKFRGRSVSDGPLPPGSRIKRSLASLVNLLAEPGAGNLLADRQDALP